MLLSLQNAIQKKEKELQSLKAYHETAGKKKGIPILRFLSFPPLEDNSFLLPHVTLLNNGLDPTLTEHFLLPTMVPLVDGAIVAAGAALGHPGKTTSKGHGRKVQPPIRSLL